MSNGSHHYSTAAPSHYMGMPQYSQQPSQYGHGAPHPFEAPQYHQGGFQSYPHAPYCYSGQDRMHPVTNLVPTPTVVPRRPKSPPMVYTHSPYAQPLAHNACPTDAFNPTVYHHHRADSFDSSSHSSIAGHNDRSLSDESSDSDSSSQRTKSVNDDRSSSHNQKQKGGIVHITVEVINTSVGKVTTIASSPHGSSFLQAALRQYPIEAFEVVHKEVAPVMGKLLQDKHACYVVKMVLEMMDKEEAISHLDAIAGNEDILLTLCTKDLHSRRMVQFILDFAHSSHAKCLFKLVMSRPLDIVRTQQGCITMQRILDHFSTAEKEVYFATVRSQFMEYALDPFGNYIVQYMLAEGNQVENSNTLSLYCRGQLHNMVCHKYASNVIEKCFGLVTPELQHDIIEELFNAPEPTLMRVLTDSSANYVVQAAIRTASFRDVTLISSQISGLVSRVHHGKKLQQRLTRRLKQ